MLSAQRLRGLSAREKLFERLFFFSRCRAATTTKQYGTGMTARVHDILSGVFDFSDLFTDLARACLGFLEFPVELVRVRASTYCGVLGLRAAHRALGVGPRAAVKLGREKPG